MRNRLGRGAAFGNRPHAELRRVRRRGGTAAGSRSCTASSSRTRRTTKSLAIRSPASTAPSRQRRAAVWHRYGRARHALCGVPEMPGIWRQGRSGQSGRRRQAAGRASRLSSKGGTILPASCPASRSLPIVGGALKRRGKSSRCNGTKARPADKAAMASPIRPPNSERRRRNKLRHDGDAPAALRPRRAWSKPRTPIRSSRMQHSNR